MFVYSVVIVATISDLLPQAQNNAFLEFQRSEIKQNTFEVSKF